MMILLFLVTGGSLHAQVVNEVQSSNVSTHKDDLNGYPDWIELHNPTSATISLTGYGLSDNATNPFKWVFPNVSIPANGYLLVYASGENRTNPTQPLHTNFSLSVDGEPVMLTHSNGTRLDLFPAVALYTGISYGRTATGFGYFAQPTPGSANTSISFARMVSPPVFSRAGGMYLTSVSLTITAEAGATIHYTTDGSMPTPGVSAVYSAPINFTTTQRIRAIATRTGDLQSDVVTHTYARVSSTIPTWSSNLPIVVLMQHNLPITPGDKTPASMILIDKGADGRARLAGPTTLHTRVDADIRGSSSQQEPQKMYGVELRTEWNGNRDEALLGMPADHNWILYAPYGEKTVMRNVMAYSLAAQMGRWAPRTRFVEVFLHSGTGSVSQSHYVGIYVLVERIRVRDHRVDIDNLYASETTAPDITGGYIIAKDRLNAGESGFVTALRNNGTSGTRLRFVDPDEFELATAQKNYMRTYMTNFESALDGSTFANPDVGYAAYIDTDSFIDHFLITEFLKEIDGYRLSTFMHKNKGEKVVMGPVWDFNISAGNANYLSGEFPTGWYYDQLPTFSTGHCGGGCEPRGWYVRMMQDPAYMQKLRYRWWELRRTVFSNANIIAMIDANAALVNEAQVRHFAKWPILGQYVWPNAPGYATRTTYASEVDWMKNWLVTRLAWLDAQMGAAPESTDRQLTRFFHINDAVVNNMPLTQLNASFPANSGARIEFKSALAGYPFTSTHPSWRKASMERRNEPTTLNAFPSVMTGSTRGLQIKQPFRGDAGGNELIFHLSTAGSSGMRFAFAVMDEGAAERLIIDYSTVSGTPVWTTSKLNRSVFAITEEYQRFVVDFMFIPEVDENPNFKIRIRFDGPNLEADNGNRVTFNNVSFEAARTSVGIDDGDAQAPERFELEQNVPNPFNPETMISFSVQTQDLASVRGQNLASVRGQDLAPMRTRLKIYDLLGREVAVLVDGVMPAGRHSVRFDGTGLASGVYIYRLESGGRVETRKMVLLK